MANECSCGRGDNVMKYYVGSVMYNSDYLEHFGILGQKWGVRRFQNKDGTLTAAGKDRYRDEGGVVQKLKADHAAKLKSRAMTSGNPRLVNKYSSLMTNQELRDATERVRLRQELVSRIPKKQKKGLVDKIADGTANAMKLFNAYKSADTIISTLMNGKHLPGLKAKKKINKAQQAARELLDNYGDMTMDEIKRAYGELERIKKIQDIAGAEYRPPVRRPAAQPAQPAQPVQPAAAPEPVHEPAPQRSGPSADQRLSSARRNRRGGIRRQRSGYGRR